MMCQKLRFHVFVSCVILLAAIVSVAVAQPDARKGASRHAIAEVWSYGPEVIFEPMVEADAWLLRVSGPQGFNFSREFQSGEEIHLRLEDEHGSRPDGQYTYELETRNAVIAGGFEDGYTDSGVKYQQAGQFLVSGGSIDFGVGMGSNWQMGAGGPSSLGLEMVDSSTGNRVLRLADGALQNSIVVDSAGEVGLGTSAPIDVLHLRRSDGTARLRIEEWSPTVADRLMTAMINNGGAGFRLENRNRNSNWGFFLNNRVVPTFTISRLGSGVFEFEFKQNGDLVIQGNLSQLSDRDSKENLGPVDEREVLARLDKLAVHEWNYKSDPEDSRHIGPMAQDFRELFRLGADDRHISPSDLSGVALVALKALQGQIRENEAEMAQQRTQIEELKQQIQLLLDAKPSAR